MTTPAQAVTPDAEAQSTAQAVALELAARDLYDTAIASKATDPVWAALREQHESYAQRLAGLIGVSAKTADDELYTSFEDRFAAADPTEAAIELENALAAGHTERLAESTHATTASVLASIITAEARQATVLALLSGETDPAVLYVNPSNEAGA